MLPKLGKSFCKAAWGKGGKEATGRFHLVSSFRTKTFAWVTLPSFKSPLTTSGIQNSRVCVQDRRCQAEEWDFRQHWGTGCCTCRCTGCAYWKPVGNTHPDLATFSSRAGAGSSEACEAAVGQFAVRFRGKGTIWHVAGSRGSGRLSLAHSWPQLAAGSLRTARPLPKVLPERGRAAKRGAGGRGRTL